MCQVGDQLVDEPCPSRLPRPVLMAALGWGANHEVTAASPETRGFVPQALS